MFTGIVTHRGLVEDVVEGEGGGRRLVVRPEPAVARAGVGSSVAVDGVCLTVAALAPDGLAFDVVPETLRRTTLGRRRRGDRVNLEPSLRLGDEMGGHWVQGHVEGRAVVAALERQGEDVRLVLRVPEGLFRGAIPKGSVALDGVSLTVGETWRDGEDGGLFSVYLVPHTLAVTGLGAVAPGDEVNVEPDVLGRWVEHHLRWATRPAAPAAARSDETGAGR